jgi:hypothetical protein
MATKSQQRKNRLALADMLENRISDKNFDMSEWTNDCGTIGCALGIAVLSGEFEGYRWGKDADGFGVPVKDGKEQHWNNTGSKLFGYEAMNNVFCNDFRRSKERVAAELRAIK